MAHDTKKRARFSGTKKPGSQKVPGFMEVLCEKRIIARSQWTGSR
jgi:hypothetical protein